MAKLTSTQAFTEIQEIREDVVLYTNGTACLIIEALATNFALLSQEEKAAQISAYAAFLNSLSSSLQIVVLNKRIDITAYINLLEREIQKSSNVGVVPYLEQYKAFVSQLVKQNAVLDKKFFIVVSYSPYEKSPLPIHTGTSKLTHNEEFFESAKITLHTKAEGLRAQLRRLTMQTHILHHEQITQLYHELYNPELTSEKEKQGGTI
jgi:hypothetical protein